MAADPGDVSASNEADAMFIVAPRRTLKAFASGASVIGVFLLWIILGGSNPPL